MTTRWPTVAYARAFADHHFHESEDTFRAALRDDARSIKALALLYRQEIIAEIERRLERSIQSKEEGPVA